MKKTYIIPETVTVSLRPMAAMLTSSPDVKIGGGEVEAGDVDVKEITNGGGSLWDSEW